MIARFRFLAVAAVALVAGRAMAQVPAALDRIPSDVAVAISVKDIGKLKAGIESMAKALGVPAAQMEGMMKVDQVLGMQGADVNGSAAIGILSLDGEEPEAIAVLPVRDYAAFMKNFGGSGAGIEEIKLDTKPVYVKNIEGGFAVAGPDKALVEKFGGKPGNGKAHEALMGAAGKAIASTRDVVIVANISKVGDHIKEALAGVKESVDMAMMMAGQNADTSIFEKFSETFVRDGAAGIIGVGLTDAGLTIDFAAQFKEGSESAGYFASKGSASKLIAALPNQQSLFAGAIDISSPSMRKILKDIQQAAAKMQEAAGEKDAPGFLPSGWADSADGIAFQMGNSPSPMGSLFVNTVAYIKTSDAAKMGSVMKDGMLAVNGKTVKGMTYETTYQEGVKAGELTVDAWTMKMTADPEDPEAVQMSQAMGMLFGPNGLSGYTAKTDGGLVMTYAKNTALVQRALAAAKGGENMNADPEVAKIAAELPADRSFEGYIGVQGLVDTALAFMGMMGMAPNIAPPENIPPVGMGAATHDGGIRMTVVIPTKVMTSVKSLMEAMDGGGGNGGDDKGDGGQMKF